MTNVEDEEVVPETCGLCGMVIPDGQERIMMVPDSSVINALDPKFDGMRVIIGCTSEHLAELKEQFEARPYVEAELWAGKMARVVQQHPRGVSAKIMARKTGLSSEQLEAGMAWSQAAHPR